MKDIRYYADIDRETIIGFDYNSILEDYLDEHPNISIQEAISELMKWSRGRLNPSTIMNEFIRHVNNRVSDLDK